MNRLSEIKANIFYVKEGEKYVRQKELIFLISETHYEHNSEGGVVRTEKVSQARFVMSEKNMNAMIKMLEVFRDAEEKDFA